MKIVYPTCTHGHTNPPGAKFCLTCGEPVGANPHPHTPFHPSVITSTISPPYTPDNNSGCGQIFDTTIPVPAEIKGWNWGAFLMPGIWAPFNRVWIGLLAWIPYVGWIVCIWFGLKGNELAWKSKRWASVEQFREQQQNWAIAGAIVMVLCFIIGILIGMSSS